MPKKFTDAQLDELLAKGYLIVPGYYSGEQLASCKLPNAVYSRHGRKLRMTHHPVRATLTEFPPLKWLYYVRSWTTMHGNSHVNF